MNHVTVCIYDTIGWLAVQNSAVYPHRRKDNQLCMIKDNMIWRY